MFCIVCCRADSGGSRHTGGEHGDVDTGHKEPHPVWGERGEEWPLPTTRGNPTDPTNPMSCDCHYNPCDQIYQKCVFCFRNTYDLHKYKLRLIVSNWLIDCFVFYAISEIFQPCNSGYKFRDLTQFNGGMCRLPDEA